MLENYRYLYVEDDAMSRDVMELIMETIVVTDKYTIFDSSTNFEARLAELSGIPDIIALTASVMNAQIKQLKDAGFDGAIGKPLNVETLPTLLERILTGEAIWAIS